MPARNSRRSKTLATIVIGCALSYPAVATPISWDLSKIGLAGASAFTADALKANEVSHIVFTSPTTFSEHGFAKIIGISQGGVISTPSGLNSSYSLYFDFTATGDLVTGLFTTFGMTLYGVNGASTFGIDANNNAFVNNGAQIAIMLASNAFLHGSVGGSPGTDLSADSLSIFSATAAGNPAFLSPQLPSGFHGAFFHSASEPGGITLLADGVVIQGGDDTLTFVPELQPWLLLIAGVPGIVLVQRKMVQNKMVRCKTDGSRT